MIPWVIRHQCGSIINNNNNEYSKMPVGSETHDQGIHERVLDLQRNLRLWDLKRQMQLVSPRLVSGGVADMKTQQVTQDLSQLESAVKDAARVY